MQKQTSYSEQKKEIIDLLNRGRFPQAVNLLEKMAALNNSAATEFVQWAKEELPRAQAAPTEWQEKVPTLFKTARQMVNQYDYHQAIGLLQQIPVDIRPDNVQRYLDETIDRHEESELLLKDLKTCVKNAEFTGIEDNLNRYLELKPISRFGRDLQQKLETYSHLEPHERDYRFGPDGELLECVEGVSYNPKLFATLGVVIVMLLLGLSTYIFKVNPYSSVPKLSNSAPRPLKGNDADLRQPARKPISLLPSEPPRLPNGPAGIVMELKGHTDYVTGVDISPSGRLIASCSADKTIRIWDLATQSEIRQFDTESVCEDIKFVNQGRQLLATSRISFLCDAHTGEVLMKYPAGATVEACSLSEDESLVSAHSRKPEVLVWETESGKLIQSLEGIKQGFGLGSGFVDNNRLLVTGPDVEGAFLCRLIDTRSGKIIQEYPDEKNRTQNWSGHTIVSSEKTHFLTSDWQGVIETAVTGDQPPRVYREKRISSFGYTSDEKYIYGSSKYGVLTFWDRKTGNVVHQIETGNYSLIESQLSPDDQYIVTAGGGIYSMELKGMETDGDFAVRLWRLPKDLSASVTDPAHQVPAKDVLNQTISSPQITKKALKFDGNDWVEIPKLKFAGTVPVTLEAVVEPEKLNSKQTVIGNFNFAGLGIEIYKSRWNFIFHNSQKYSQAGSDQNIVVKVPVHVAGVFDGKNISIYINGKKQKKQTPVPGGHRNSPFPFFIGADPDGNGKPQKPFYGIIHAIRVSDQARYSGDFHAPSRLVSDRATVALYDVSQGCDGKKLTDLSKNSFHGTIHGAKVVDTKAPHPVRYVRIELPTWKYLHLAEVQVFRGGENIATKGTATQSSTEFGGVASRAIDGNTDGNHWKSKSISHTAFAKDSWWELDLGSEISIDRVIVWNRTETNEEGVSLHARLNGFHLIGLDSDRNVIFTKTTPVAPKVKAEFQMTD